MQQTQKVLIVDDNEHNVAILELILEEYILETAANGNDALAVAHRFRPDLILLDVMMPGMSGYEVCRTLRDDKTFTNTKIIMVSAKAMTAERVKGYEMGADDYITKPFDEDELLAKVRVYLRLKSLEEVAKMKNDLLSLLSHELNTPLNQILPALELLQDDDDMNVAERRQWLDIIRSGVTGLEALFDRIMTLNQLKSGTSTFECDVVDICEIMRGEIHALTMEADKRDIHLIDRLPGATHCSVDIQYINRVFAAVLDNAIRYSPEGSDVLVELEPNGSTVTLLIADDGPGIDPELIPAISDGFAVTDVSHHSSGHGLSLAIANEIMIAHNGHMEWQLPPDGGTTVAISIPASVGTD